MKQYATKNKGYDSYTTYSNNGSIERTDTPLADDMIVVSPSLVNNIRSNYVMACGVKLPSGAIWVKNEIN